MCVPSDLGTPSSENELDQVPRQRQRARLRRETHAVKQPVPGRHERRAFLCHALQMTLSSAAGVEIKRQLPSTDSF